MKRKEYYTVSELCELLEITRPTIDRYVKNGIFRCKKIKVSKNGLKVFVKEKLFDGCFFEHKHDEKRHLQNKIWLYKNKRQKKLDEKKRKDKEKEQYRTVTQLSKTLGVHENTTRTRYKKGEYEGAKKIGGVIYIPSKYAYTGIKTRKKYIVE